MNRLDVATLPLAGTQLIEASAGTGKTHAITSLYLRLLLETAHGVRELLVVTFTHAATDELRARIRRRMVDAVQAIDAGSSNDPGLQALLQAHIDSDGGVAARRKLARAIAGIDEAAIFTIHAFCQRVLREQAFESGEPFDNALLEDTGELVARAVADGWRQRFYPDAALAGFAAASPHLATPYKTHGWLRDVLARELEVRLPPCDVQALRSLAGDLHRRWPAEREGLCLALEENPHLSRKRDKSMHGDLVAALAALDAWAAGTDLAPAAAASALTQEKLDGMVTDKRREKGGHAPQLPYAQALGRLFTGLRALELNLLGDAREDARRRIDEQKRRAGLFGFDDLIQRLRAALLAEGGERLAARLAARYPAAMIDEFQDTDPAQYDVFSRVYRDRPGTCLLMIGDPKQAIYSFRGADIYAYVRARHATAPAQRHTLNTNWRSTAALVEGVDALFSRLPEPFLMGGDVAWVKVEAAGRADREPMLLDGVTPVPLQFCIADDDERYNKDTFRDAAASATANRCAELLNAAAQGRALLKGVPLAPRDIAILVRSHHEGALMQQALLARGIGSALASRHSVFDTHEARDLLAVLDALREPGNERALRRALVTPLWGTDAGTLAALLSDEAAWENLLEQVHDWHRLWTSRGFMPMFRRWLHGARVPARLLARPQGERTLTNLLHLAELLQDASRRHAAPDALRLWLARGIAGDDDAGDARQLRLESDENLVQVVTMHKSKGLQYPVVFLPFAGTAREAGKRDDKPLYHDQAGQLLLDYVDTATATAAAAREALAEDMRLLYVALTRAEQLCCVQWGAVPGFSALALLLLGEPGESLDTVRARHAAVCGSGANRRGASNRGASNREVAQAVQRLVEQHPRALALHAPPPADVDFVAPATDPARWQARTATRALQRDWRVTSFSALASQSADSAEHSPALPVGSAGEDAVDEDSGDTGQAGSSGIAAFPRGTRAGHFFHELLEHLDFPAARGPWLEHVIRQQCLRHDIPGHWVSTVASAIADMLDTPLADGLLLRQLTAAHRRNECEFYYPLARLDARALESVVPGLAGHDTHTPRFTFSPVSGQMHGYIDLVFEHGGRWYVADWKTNWLGPTSAHYGGEALAHAMRHHAYDLQYWVYTIALHRHLRQKLGEAYDYDRHVGGVYYFFLRGMHPAHGLARGVFFDKPARAQVEALDALLRGGNPA